MIEIDKKDKLYTYLSNLGVEDVDNLYIELAQNGRYSPKEVQTYFYAEFQPSITKEIDDKEIEQIVDYYADLKTIKQLNETELNKVLKRYKQSKNDTDKTTIINAKLRELMYLSINYKSMHEDANIQDVIQIANLGLLKALEKYNPNAKIAFKDYIIYWVREEINKELKNA